MGLKWKAKIRFVLVGVTVQSVAIAMLMVSAVIWADFLHINPHRSQSNALEMVLVSPFDGLFAGMMFSELWLIVGAFLTGEFTKRWGRVPLWTLLITGPICAMCYTIQRWIVWPVGDPQDIDEWQLMVLKEAATTLLAVLACWWWDKRAARQSGLQ